MKKLSKVVIIVLACLIAISSVSLGKVFAYFSSSSSASGTVTMGHLSISDIQKSDGTDINWNITNLQPNQSFGGSYKVEVTSNINYYIRILFKANVTPLTGKSHATNCGDNVTDDTDILNIVIDGAYTKSDTKTSDGYTAYYKLTPRTVTSATTTETFSVDLKAQNWVGSGSCDYYMGATVSINMQVEVMQADYLESQNAGGTVSSVATMHTLWSTCLGTTGGSTTPTTPTSLYTRVNASGVEDSNGSYILFGYYPTTIKADSVTVGTTTDTNGYYTGSDGAKYAKLSANPFDTNYTFSNGSTITSGTQYYFKVEQIKWRILTESNGTAMLLCESIIDAGNYWDSYNTNRTIDGATVYPNNYKYSRIRAWLNGLSYTGTSGTVSTYSNAGFLQKAFTAAEQGIIQTTTVNNAASTTDSSGNSYACANTNDKVYLLSYQDLINTSYGFNSSSSNYDPVRRKQTTDYARANYAYTNTSGDYVNKGWWWSRSPYSYGSKYAWDVYGGGGIDYYDVYRADGGVVPALTIAL